jgi:integrase
MPLITTKRKGSPFFQITGTVAGERIRQSAGTADKGQAEEEAARLEREIRQRRIYGPPAVATFAQAVNLYIDDGGEARFLKPLVRVLGRRRLSDLTPGLIRSTARKLLPHASPSTWNRQVITPAGAVINNAHDHGLCPPIRIKRFKTQKPERRAIDREWIDKFRSATKVRYLQSLALFMFQTGARISEAVAMEPKDLDLMRRRAYFGKTKNGEPHEAVLTREMVIELANLPPRNGRIFGYQSRYGPRTAWKNACNKAGIIDATFHEGGRHSFATEAIVRKRIDLPTVARLGNWKSLSLLAETYAHPEDLDGVVDEVFGTPVTHKGKGKGVK